MKRTLYGLHVEWVKGQGVQPRWHRYVGDDGRFTVTACGRRIVESEQLNANLANEDGTPVEGDMCTKCKGKGK